MQGPRVHDVPRELEDNRARSLVTNRGGPVAIIITYAAQLSFLAGPVVLLDLDPTSADEAAAAAAGRPVRPGPARCDG